MSFKLKFWSVVGFQLFLLFAMMGYKQVTLVTGQRILLKTVPVDPRDMFRGDYVALRYDISTVMNWQTGQSGFQRGDTIYVTLHRYGRFWVIQSAAKVPPEEGTLFLKGKVESTSQENLRAIYGIESYFMPEGKALELQQKAGRGLVAEVSVNRHGHAVLRKAYIDPSVTHP